MNIAPYAKAVVGFIAPGATILVAALLPASDEGSLISVAEWLTALFTCIITAATVYAVPNKPVTPPAE